MGRASPCGPPPASGVLIEAPLLGRKKELADVLQLLEGGPLTIVGPPGIGKSRLIDAVAAERPETQSLLRESRSPPADPGERVYRLKPLAEAPAVELYRLLAEDDETPYAEIAARTRAVGRVPGAIARIAQS